MKQPMKPFFSAAKKESVLELLVYESIGEDWWSGGGVTAKSVAQQIKDAGDFSSISVRINSPGGDAFEGAAIYNLLRSQGKPVNVYIDGVAASAASAIAMAGDTRAIGSNAMIMIHNAWSLVAGDARDMRKMADTLDKVSTSLGQVYVERTGNDAETVKAMMDEETWMGGDDAISNGFATELMNQDEDESEAAAALAALFRMEKKFKAVPETFRAAAAAPPASAAAEEPAAVEASNLSLYEARLKLVRAIL